MTGLSIESPEGKAIADRRREIFRRDFLPHLQPTRGAQRLLEWLRDDRKKLVVASSAEEDELKDLLRVAGAAKMFESTASSDDAERSKPDPDIVVAAIKQANCPVADIIMVGDTPYDVEAALRAGIEIIGLRSGGWSDAELRGAVAIYDDPADLLEHYDLSPFTPLGRGPLGVTRDPLEVHALRLPQRRPQIADLLQPGGHRFDRERLAVEPLVHFLPGERRRHAGVVAGARAVGGRQRLAEDVLQAVDVDALAARGDRALDGGDLRDASARRRSRRSGSRAGRRRTACPAGSGM